MPLASVDTCSHVRTAARIHTNLYMHASMIAHVIAPSFRSLRQ